MAVSILDIIASSLRLALGRALEKPRRANCILQPTCPGKSPAYFCFRMERFASDLAGPPGGSQCRGGGPVSSLGFCQQFRETGLGLCRQLGDFVLAQRRRVFADLDQPYHAHAEM